MSEHVNIARADSYHVRQLRNAVELSQTSPMESLQWLRNLADSGSAMSMVHLGFSYETGVGTFVDLAKAEEWYKRAADTGSVTGSFWFGRLCLRQKRYEEAKEAFGSAAERGSLPSLYFLGCMFWMGWGVDADEEKATAYFATAMDGGHVPAMFALSRLFMNGKRGWRQWIHGLLLRVRANASFFVVAAVDGLSSDRLRH